ncbi:MAG: hypothetical protein J0H83_05685 [Candidatus Melainabacteria bacterium]|nr:hypothetical protein [Candidatus Melainabacteria bacterium]
MAKPQMVALTLTIALLAAQIQAHAGTGEWGGSVCIAKSKTDHLYIGNVEMSPASFCLAGKTYQVREAWLEHQVIRPGKHLEIGKGYTLCLTVLEDGSREINYQSSPRCLDFILQSDIDNFRCIELMDKKRLREGTNMINGNPIAYIRHIFFIDRATYQPQLKAFARFTAFRMNNLSEKEKVAYMDEIKNGELAKTDFAEVIFKLPELPQ